MASRPAASRYSFRCFGCLLLVWMLAHCGTQTSSIEVPPPPVESRLSAEALDPLDCFVELGAPDTQRHILSGIEHDQQTGQWQAQSGAILRFLTLPLDELLFGLNIKLPAELLVQSKPLNLRVNLNGNLFIERPLDIAGPQSIDEAVPKGLVSWERETHVEIIIELPVGRPIERTLLQIINVGFRP